MNKTLFAPPTPRLALLTGLALVALGLTGRVHAQQQAYTNGQTAVFESPGSDQVIGQWPSGVSVVLYGCLQDQSWCQVGLGDAQGWVSSNNLVGLQYNQQVEVGNPGWNIPLVIYSGPVYYGNRGYGGQHHDDGDHYHSGRPDDSGRGNEPPPRVVYPAPGQSGHVPGQVQSRSGQSAQTQSHPPSHGAPEQTGHVQGNSDSAQH
jgi:uncharacterized protein YraI